MRYTDEKYVDFLHDLASNRPTPGGGGASALVAAVGIACGEMVTSLTIGKKKYANVEKEIQILQQQSAQIQQELLAWIQKDADAFLPLAQAYKMPKVTKEEQQQKASAMEIAIKEATIVPLALMKKCGEAIDIIEEIAEKGSKMAISDAGCGALFCKSALQSASLNVYINTNSMQNKQLAVELEKQADNLLMEYIPKADKIYTLVMEQIRKDG